MATQPEKRENSVLFSLRELRQIEENRVQEEEHAVRSAEETRVRTAQEAEQRQRELEEAKLREERDAQLQIETARENAEREARMRVESAEATERQRQQAALEQQRLQHEMELRRAEVAKKRPTWMLAVTAIALIGVVIAIVLVVKFSGQSDEDKQLARQAEIDKKKAEEVAEQALARVDTMERDLKELDKKITQSIDAVVAATTEAERSAAKSALEKQRRDKAEMEARMAEARAAAAKATRNKGFHVSEECKNNPLAHGCS